MTDLDRRRFLSVSAVTVAGAAVGACGGGGGDGAAAVPEEGMVLGTLDEVRGEVEAAGGVWVREDLRAYVVAVPEELRGDLGAAVPAAAAGAIDVGLLAVAERCPHQGCRVPLCEGSGWFECPCHGSRFTQYGELRRGPADRGMSYLPLAVEGDQVRLLRDPVDGLGEDVDVSGVPDPGDHCA